MSIQLSHSSKKTLMTCQQKYHHYKVAQTPKDPDHVEADSLNFGKAFHWVLEQTKHESWNENLVMAAMVEFEVDPSDKAMLSVMLDNYVKLHKLSGLKVVKCEQHITTPVFQGFIDFIAQDTHGWWIGDNKTAARHDPTIVARLPKDPQLNLYSYFATELASALSLKGPFLGARYRQSIKSKAQTVSGLSRACKTYDIVVRAEEMDPVGAWQDHLEAHQIAVELHNGVAPKKNFNACFDYFRPCEYFSKCHGKTFTDGQKSCQILTLESFEEAELL